MTLERMGKVVDAMLLGSLFCLFTVLVFCFGEGWAEVHADNAKPFVAPRMVAKYYRMTDAGIRFECQPSPSQSKTDDFYFTVVPEVAE